MIRACRAAWARDDARMFFTESIRGNAMEVLKTVSDDLLYATPSLGLYTASLAA